MVTCVRLAVGFGIIRRLQRLGCLTSSLFLVVSLLLLKIFPVGFFFFFSCRYVLFPDKRLFMKLYTNVYATHTVLCFLFLVLHVAGGAYML